MRQPHFRGVLVLLECGHEKVLASSFYRLTDALCAMLIDHAIRGGTWCPICKAMCMPEKALGTCRL